MVNLLHRPSNARITTPKPQFSWIVRDTLPGSHSIGSQILVASSPQKLLLNDADLWDSGAPDFNKVWQIDNRSTMVAYEGRPLEESRNYYWKVRTWNRPGDAGPWSEIQMFRTADFADNRQTDCPSLTTSDIEPMEIVQISAGQWFMDFGRAAFGTIVIKVESNRDQEVEVHLGEVLERPHHIHRNPGGSRRYCRIPLKVKRGTFDYLLEIPPDPRNTLDFAIHMPDELFEVYPFRYCEISGINVELRREDIRQRIVFYPFDDNASHFRSSCNVLNDVWELCKYSIKATSFCGYYVDGDRERIPYEADAYINQLCHYTTDREYAMARRTHEHLMLNPTWPTEWIIDSVLIAWNDYLYTGDTTSLAGFYEDLKAKTLIDLEDDRGFIAVERMTDDVLRKIHYKGESMDLYNRSITNIVDWPQSERDEYEFFPVNSVINALHYRALLLFARIARILGKSDDAQHFQERATILRSNYRATLINPDSGLVVDGEGSDHCSLHANMFAMASDLIPDENKPAVCEFIKSKGMACSVYGAQFLMEALYNAGCDDYALSLLSSTGERSWGHMVYDVGTTITLEAWDDRLKPNQDWNHAWGAVPANVIPRNLMGIQPLKPGFEEILIFPQPGSLQWAELTTPSIRGPIKARFSNHPGEGFHMEIETPSNTTTRVQIPRSICRKNRIILDGKAIRGIKENGYVRLDNIGSGRHAVTAS